MNFSPLTISFKGDRAYIYIWVSKKWDVLYVGQTNNANGTLGRALGHIKNEGTLRNRFEERVGIELENVNDLLLLSFPLPKEKKYVSNESCFREAIEYLVQINLYFNQDKVRTPYNIISNVRSNNLVGKKYIEEIANNITSDFINIYNEL